MASCKEQQEKVEEDVLQRVDHWEDQQQERCENEPCNPWLLCANTLLCWLVWVAVKVSVWVTVVVVRWVYRLVCVAASLVLGVLALLIGNYDILLQALSDTWELIKDAFFFAVGALILWALSGVDAVQTAVGAQNKKRPLTKRERELLRPIFGDLFVYDAIRIVEGDAGLLSGSIVGQSGSTFTIGFNIYTPAMDDIILVHECVHVWQFQFGGTQYIGQSAIFQAMFSMGMGGYPYDWESVIGTNSNAWYLLESVEAQAKFIENVFVAGRFIFDDGSPADAGPGAFFSEAPGGQNEFLFPQLTGTDYTDIANQAWRTIRTG